LEVSNRVALQLETARGLSSLGSLRFSAPFAVMGEAGGGEASYGKDGTESVSIARYSFG
jgi:hypothetical protein